VKKEREETMFSQKPSLRIDRIEKVEITTPFHPFWEKILADHLSHVRKELENQRDRSIQLYPSPESESDRPTAMLRFLDALGKIVSIVSGLAVITFVILVWAGKSTIGTVQIGTLLTVVSFTLIGGLVSIGGVKMFSINAHLRRARDRIERVFHTSTGCPFVSVVDDQAVRDFDLAGPLKVGSQDFCQGCHLVDLRGRTVCKISPYYRE
jgi:hypothetical protein